MFQGTKRGRAIGSGFHTETGQSPDLKPIEELWDVPGEGEGVSDCKSA